MGTLSSWMIMVPGLFLLVCVVFVALFTGIALAGESPIPPWDW
jgi:hypothetical protein